MGEMIAEKDFIADTEGRDKQVCDFNPEHVQFMSQEDKAFS